MRLTSRPVAVLAATALVSASVLTLAEGTAGAVSADIVISQVYGGGGNSGAPYRADFIELYNRGAVAVGIAGWSVQYASASGTTWLKTALSGTVQPGRYYLVQEYAGTTGAALPAPDATGSTNLSASAGKVALVTSSTTLSCGSSCHAAAGVRDFVGYGSANDYEGSPAPTISNTTADLRAGGGASDTDNNGVDFTAGAPTPRNSASTPSGPRVHDIQGAAHLSPYKGRTVSAVPGVVTAVATSGFWLQDPSPDTSVATSEGIYVYTSSRPTVAVADSVTVSGTVNEYRVSGTATNLTTTEIASPNISTKAHGAALPAATVIGSGGRVPPGAVIEDDATGSVETSGVFDPGGDGIDFWESLEGMRVELDNAAVVGPRNSYGELPIVPSGSSTRTNRGGIVLQSTDANPERVILDDVLAATPAANVGDTLTGATVGVLDYSFGNYKLLVTAAPAVSSGGLAREITRPALATELSTATFNVENLSPADPAAKFSRLAGYIVTNLAAPDLVALEEIQDNSGPTDNGVVAADQTMSLLTSAIQSAGGPSYGWREIDPVNDADGGQPGGNIRQVFLYRTDRGLSFVDRPGGTATTATAVVTVGGQPQLTYSPGRIDPTNSAFNASRKPLAGEFTWQGKQLFVIANHFNSKGGDDPLYGVDQPPQRSSETQRHQQATVVAGFVDQLLAVSSTARVIVLGDLNDFDYSQTANILVGSGSLVDLPRTLPVAERYSYDYDGNSQVLDHILISTALGGSYSYDVVHVNCEFADQASDHDPQVVRLSF